MSKNTPPIDLCFLKKILLKKILLYMYTVILVHRNNKVRRAAAHS